MITPRQLSLLPFEKLVGHPLLTSFTRKNGSISSQRSQMLSRRSASDELRFLDEDYYKEAASNFNAYEPGLWLPTLRLNVSFFMIWPFLLITICSTILTYAMVEVVPEAAQHITIPKDAHITLGSVLGFLLVFRTNSSYARWWEARCVWSLIIDTCRSLCILVTTSLRDGDDTRARFLRQLMGFVVTFKNFLRDEPTVPEELGKLLDWTQMKKLNGAASPPVAALHTLGEIVRLGLDDAHEVLQASTVAGAFDGIQVLINSVGVCERIKNTPLTFGYISTLRTFLIMWVLAFPLAFADMCGGWVWEAPAVTAAVAFMMLNLEAMSIEIEGPFGDDPNDLPIEEYCLGLETILLEFYPADGLQKRVDGEAAAQASDARHGTGDARLRHLATHQSPEYVSLWERDARTSSGE
mmetsp:Transcript_65831/g.109401  ORF Transcript_65831/g.109401 Transcript_65831/m.109401 type:complete len:410 (-) Transcript_65831:204-1433(-)